MKQGGGEQTLTVALRIRPLSEDEILLGATPIAHKVDENMIVLMDPTDDPDDILRANRSRERNYMFDHSFDGVATQTDVYSATTKVLIPNVVSGYNATVFAYGATGAGKTYTMLGTDDEPGIMARTLNDLFLEMDKTKQEMSYKVTMSYLEIYNEMIRDLLNPTSGILDLREDAKGGVQVAGLSEVTATSTSEVMKMLILGNLERTQEPTAANLTSSRSHAVLQVHVRQMSRLRDVTQEVRNGCLFLIDLAGSERAANTHNRGKRMVEGAHINRSLLALGNCINALSTKAKHTKDNGRKGNGRKDDAIKDNGKKANDKKDHVKKDNTKKEIGKRDIGKKVNGSKGDKSGSKYVNYRDSKLTRLLKDALGGNCKTVMIAHVSPASIHFEESRNTLVYADRAKHIKTKVRRNVTDVSYHIAQYTNIISELKHEIARLRQKVADEHNHFSVANIQEVHREILSGKNEKEHLALAKLKEQLLVSFKEQMEFRRNLMELTNSSMEISLETSRNQLVISEWEAERTRNKRESSDDEKESESGVSPEPDEVRIARDELKVLHEEKQRTDKLRMGVQKELTAAKGKVISLQESLPKKVSQKKHKEILRLLCRVHQLEIENMELQSECFIRDFQIRKKDMMIKRYKLHKSLCDEIIQQQKALIDDGKLTFTKELEDLYDLYTVETGDGMLSRDHSRTSFVLHKDENSGSKHTLDMDLSSEDGSKDSVKSMSKRDVLMRSSENMLHKEDQLFRMSAKAKQLQQRRRSYEAPPDSDRLDEIQMEHLEGIHDVSQSTKTPSPTRHSITPEDRQTILSRTRKINVLAQRKRNKAQLNMLNYDRQLAMERTLYRLSPPTDLASDSETYLSPSRLAALDNEVMSHRQPSFESGNVSLEPDHRIPDNRFVDNNRLANNRYKNNLVKDNRRGPVIPVARIQNNTKKRGHYRSSEQLHPSTLLPRPMRINRKVPPIPGKNPHTVSETSNLSTPKARGTKKPVKQQPTIPSYRKGDISVMGHGVTFPRR